MLRWTKWIAPVAGLVLLAGLQQAQAGDDAPGKPEGKAKITVTVVDDAGKPVSGASVMLMAGGGGKKAKGAEPTTQPDAGAAPAPKGRPAPLQTAADPTSDEGVATLEKVPDGTYQVAARVKGKGNGRAKVVVAEGKDEAVTITLKAKAPK